MTAVFLGMVVETEDVQALKRWAKAKSLQPPTIYVLEPGEPKPTMKETARKVDPVAQALFDYWRERCGHPRAKPGNRIVKVQARLREGFTEEDIRKAIDGAAKNPYLDDHGVKHDDLELICRSASKLELFTARAEAKGAASKDPARQNQSSNKLDPWIPWAEQHFPDHYPEDVALIAFRIARANGDDFVTPEMVRVYLEDQ